MHDCPHCDNSFETRLALGGHIGSHSRGDIYLARRRGQRNLCLTCGTETKNAKYCSAACFHQTFDNNPVSVSTKSDLGTWTQIRLVNLTRRKLREYRVRQIECEICGSHRDMFPRCGLVMDHDHETMEFRGLLCSRCNAQLGWYEKYKEQIETYMSKVL
jgi:hypothetical protein